MGKNYRAELVGVFGDPVDDNPTGAMEEAAFAACGLNWRYITFKVGAEGLDAAVKAVRAFNMKGINLTMPHKIAVIPYLDELSVGARIIGAVNTVIAKDGMLIGENTDGKGFVQALANKGIFLEGKKVVLLGAGGAARAVGVECALAGAASITIFNRTEAKAVELARVINADTRASAGGCAWERNLAVPKGTDILINATSIGFSPDTESKPDIDYSTVASGMVVSDVVFCPRQTSFLKECASRGARIIDGLGMLACQGALNFTLWTGLEAPLKVMEDALEHELEG